MEMLILDEGYYYGMGVFETIAVENGTPVFLDRHLRRLFGALEELDIELESKEDRLSKESVMKYLEINYIAHGALKIAVSKENIILSIRENSYDPKHYEKGFLVDISPIRRNETSPFTYMKTFNYGDNILAKKQAKLRGIDEPIFLNSKGELTEGATTNIFLVKNGELYTPSLSCGLLNGIMRSYLMEEYSVTEQIIYPEEVVGYDEMFLTNSLLGIMPVKSFGEHIFVNFERANYLYETYTKEIIYNKT